METAIRKGFSPFYATDLFPAGLAHSNYFTESESEVLIQYGHTFSSLQSGKLTPVNEEEVEFLEELNSGLENTIYTVALWKKYLSIAEYVGSFRER